MAPLFWKRPPEVDETSFRTFLGTEAKSVTEFRVRRNISDNWIEWSLLTEHEKGVEVYLTLKIWAPLQEYHSPPNFVCTPMTNIRGESLLVFYPADHESNQVYIYEIDGDVFDEPVHSDYSLKNNKGGLQLFEENMIGRFFDRLKKQLDLYTFTRLVTPSNNVILF